MVVLIGFDSLISTTILYFQDSCKKAVPRFLMRRGLTVARLFCESPDFKRLRTNANVCVTTGQV